MYDILQSLHPLVVYLNSDVETALLRAVAQRGTPWLERMMQRMNTWQLALYDQKPFVHLHDVVAFDTQINQLNLALLSQWRGDSMILDTTNTPVSQLLTRLLHRMEVPEHPVQYHVDHHRLHAYVGRYVLHGASSLSKQLDVRLVNDRLVVNTYWPNGIPLVAESDTRFRLESTSRWIEFDLGHARGTPGLTYVVHGHQHHYRKTET